MTGQYGSEDFLVEATVCGAVVFGIEPGLQISSTCMGLFCYGASVEAMLHLWREDTLLKNTNETEA